MDDQPLKILHSVFGYERFRAPQAEVIGTLMAGGDDVVADIFRNRVLQRGKGSEVWGWGTAYGKPT